MIEIEKLSEQKPQTGHAQLQAASEALYHHHR